MQRPRAHRRWCSSLHLLARAQAGRLRLSLLKIGVQVVRSVRRLVWHVPRAHPHIGAWCTIARGLGAVAH